MKVQRNSMYMQYKYWPKEIDFLNDWINKQTNNHIKPNLLNGSLG